MKEKRRKILIFIMCFFVGFLMLTQILTIEGITVEKLILAAGIVSFLTGTIFFLAFFEAEGVKNFLVCFLGTISGAALVIIFKILF